MAPRVLFVAALALLLPRPAGAAGLSGFGPETLRLNSTLVATGDGVATAAGANPAIILAGSVEWLGMAPDGDGERLGRIVQDVRTVIPAVVVGDRQVRARLPRKLVDDWTRGVPGWATRSARFVGTASVGGLSIPVSLDAFPPDLLTLLAGAVGFADDDSTTPPVWAIGAALLVSALFLLLAVFALFAGMASWAERRIAGRMQNRVGPNRTGPQGVLQWLADGLKTFLKEDFIPAHGLPILFRVAPYFAMLGVVLTFVTLPFGQFLTVSDLNVGVYYVLAVTGFTVVGILIGGFASANKWSLLGGFRSAAQIVSYEIPSGLAVASVVALAGGLGFGTIIRAQGGFPWQWYLFHNPFTFGAFFIYFTAALAEGNRTPFDLPEAESELVAGYNTEYSGLRFLFFFFAEWGNLYVMSALMTALFLGGWQIPGVGAAVQATSIGLTVLGWALFTAKSMSLVFVVIWLRWTLPRVRIDQLMAACWKYLVPLGALCFLGAAAWGVLVKDPVQAAVSWAMFALGVALAALFLTKLVRMLRRAPIDVRLNPFA